MMANAAFAAALTTVLLMGWLASELTCLAPYKAVLFQLHGRLIVTATLLVFLHLSAAFYTVARWVFLRDAGRKLTHMDHQLISGDGLDPDKPSSTWGMR